MAIKNFIIWMRDFASYSYSRIGHIEDAASFADALEDGTAEVTFEEGE